MSHSDVARVARYIANQEKHHRKRTYAEEYECLLSGIVWNGALRKTIEMVAGSVGVADPQPEGWGE